MKSSDEIKKAMLHCSPVSCRSNDCPYEDDTPKYEGDMPVCRMKLWHDMGCLIQQLEAERDAAVDDLREAVSRAALWGVDCQYCKDKDKPVCNNCNWEWRGVQKEESTC